LLSQRAQQIRDGLSRDTADGELVAQRLAWERSAQQVATPAGVEITITDFAGVRCMLHTVKNQPTGNEVIAYIHGGGLVEGSIETSREWCARLAKSVKTTVISIDYRLAPEHPYPAALDDVEGVLKALVNSDNNFIVKGIGADSTGGNLLLGALFRLRDKHIRLPDAAFLLSPSIDLSFSGASFTSNVDADPMVSLEELERCAKWYAGDKDRRSKEISPIFGEFHNLPPLLIHVDADELLLDDAKSLAQQVNDAGGLAKLIVGNGLWHVWPTWEDFPEARTATQEIAEHIRSQ